MTDDETKRPTPDDMARDGGADLDAAGRHFGCHDEGCASQWDKYANSRECDCGLDVARVALPAWVRRALSAEASAAHFALKYDAALGRAHAAEAGRDALAARVAELEAAR